MPCGKGTIVAIMLHHGRCDSLTRLAKTHKQIRHLGHRNTAACATALCTIGSPLMKESIRSRSSNSDQGLPVLMFGRLRLMSPAR